MIDKIILDLLRSFPGSFINMHGEFIAHEKANTYFILKSCASEMDVKCKVLEWFSRPAIKGGPYRAEKKNQEFRKFMTDGINNFLGTKFTHEDLERIYVPLGNACDHERTINFIESGYDMKILEEVQRNG